jgi:pimeloyl-ACP methyl ester carboxylesterase
MVAERDCELVDGRTLHVYDSGDTDAALTVFWHHGTPQTGEPPVPLLPASARLGIRWVSHDRPGYGGSTSHPGRDVASVVQDAAAVADALGVERFAVMGASGGGPHALACAALLPDRVVGVLSFAGIAPFEAAGLDWYAAMGTAGQAEFRAAEQSRDALAHHLSVAEFDPDLFVPADHAALAGSWSWLGASAGRAMAAGLDGMLDDDLAFVRPWGFDLDDVVAPVLIVHGGQDRMVPASHGDWLAAHLRRAELLRSPDDGHVSVLTRAEEALGWLTEHTRGAGV